MKALRSPWVSGGLAALALAFVAYQVMGGLRGHSHASAAPAQPVAVSPAAPAPQPHGGSGPEASLSKAQPPTGSGMDRLFIGLHFTNWTEGGKRDPFLLRPVIHQDAGPNAPSQLAKLKLKAIWNQTGSRVAVLNNTLYQEGDTIEGFKILRIEDEVIWLQNANSLEHLEFRKPQVPATAATNGAKPPTL